MRRLIGDVPVFVLRAGSTARAPERVIVMFDRCSHLSAPLHEGELSEIDSELCVTCPWHASVFRVSDGAVVHGPDGMAASDTSDVSFRGTLVDRLVGGPGWYTARPGFVAGGGGVAAVWWGGAAGLLDRVFAHVQHARPDPHVLAHLGILHALLAAAHALLRSTADELDTVPRADHTVAVATVRDAVEHACREAVERTPRILGPGAWSGDGQLADMLADLQMYLRQHHGERDNAELGGALLRERQC